MEKKIAIVTGGFKGNGKAIVSRFLSEGFKVYSLDIRYKKNNFNKGSLIEFKINLEKPLEIKKIINIIKKKEKFIDVLVNNAGISLKQNKSNYLDIWNKTISINLTAVYLISIYCLSHLKKSKTPSIVNISSLNGKLGMSNNPSYNSSKGGVSALTLSQAIDFSKFGIRVNCVSPGYIRTDMTKNSFNNKKEFKKRINRMMLKKYGSPEDIANSVFFLTSDKAKYINATEIVVDGGLLKKGI